MPYDKSLAHRCCVRPRSQSGYILVLTIAALALLGLAGAFIGQRVSTALRLAAAEQNYVRDERLARNAMARYIYLLATVQHAPMGVGGDEVAIRLDGRWYDAGEGMAVSFQDGRGLINLKTAPRLWKERLLASYGIPAERIHALIDALDDYTDTDTLRRLQGAEAEDYARKGLPPPKNLPLSVKEELLRVYGWKEESKLWGQDSLFDHVTLDDTSAVNPATATWRTMVATLGVSDQIAQSFVMQRTQHAPLGAYALSSTYVKGNAAGDIFDLDKAILFPSATTVITIAPVGSKRAWRATLTLMPESANYAWQLPDMMEISLSQAPKTEILQKIPDISPFIVNTTNELKALSF